MRLTCPCCGSIASLESWQTDDDARLTLAAILRLPGRLAELTPRYLGLFRSPKSARGLAWAKARRLVDELAALVADPDLQWKDKRLLANSPDYWTQAVEAVLDKDGAGNLERPLTSHNLVRCLAYDLADRAAEAGLRQRETALRQGRREDVRPSAPEPRDTGPSESQRMYEALQAKRAAGAEVPIRQGLPEFMSRFVRAGEVKPTGGES